MGHNDMTDLTRIEVSFSICEELRKNGPYDENGMVLVNEAIQKIIDATNPPDPNFAVAVLFMWAACYSDDISMKERAEMAHKRFRQAFKFPEDWDD
jgi:hypothetical protein